MEVKARVEGEEESGEVREEARGEGSQVLV